MNVPSLRRHSSSAPDPDGPFRLVAYTDAVAWGGAEECVASIVSCLSPSIDVAILGVTDSVVREIASRRPGTTSHVLSPIRGNWDIRAAWEHVRAMRRLKPDLCHVNLRVPYRAQLGLVAALLAPGVRVVVAEHSLLAEGRRFRLALKRLTSRRADAHVAVSEYCARRIEEITGVPAGSIRTIHNGVSVRTVDPIDPGAPRPVVGSVGRIETEKGYDVLVDALAELPDVTVVLVGRGEKTEALRAQAARCGVEGRLVFAGWVEDSRAHLAGFDVFVLPSSTEGFPLTILEAMHTGIPVVASDVGGIHEAVVDGETGLLVPPGDPHALAAAIRRALDDADLRGRMTSRARKIAMEKYTVEAMAGQYEALYREVLRS